MSSFASITSSAIPLIIFQTVHVILSLHTVFKNTTNFPPSVAAKHVFNVFYLNCAGAVELLMEIMAIEI